MNDSPENTEIDAIVASYADSRIVYTKNAKNLGISASRNKLLEMARGEYIAVFDHDDISMPYRLEKQVALLDENPDIGATSGNFAEFPEPHTTNFPTTNLEIKKHLLLACVMPHTALMIRKSVLTENNIKYEAAFSPCEDYALLFRLMDKTMFRNLPDLLVRYRRFDGNTTVRQWDKMEDRGAILRNMYLNANPYLARLVDSDGRRIRNVWLYLFGIIPIIKIRPRGDKTRYLLFGILPILTLKKNR